MMPSVSAERETSPVTVVEDAGPVFRQPAGRAVVPPPDRPVEEDVGQEEAGQHQAATTAR